MRYIYVFRNLINNKVYVGQTINPARRKAGHLCAIKNLKNERPMVRSMRKHGIENFKFEVIEECTDDLVDEREKHWIAHFDSTNRKNGYNISRGGQVTSLEHHRKLSEALKGNKHCVGRIVRKETSELLRKCWPLVIERKLGKREIVTETRVCRCGTSFDVTYATNRKGHVKKFCSRSCANAKTHSEETKIKISQSLKKRR